MWRPAPLVLLAVLAACGHCVENRSICVGYYRPLSVCPEFQDDPQLAGQFSGYDVDLFEKAVDNMKTAPDSPWHNVTWHFKCKPAFSAAFDALQNGSSDCFMLIGGYDASSERLQAGIQFSVPTFKSGRAILISIKVKRNLFAFLDPFTADLWLLLFGTSAVVGLLVSLLEMPWGALKSYPKDALDTCTEFQFSAVSLLLSVTDMRPDTVGGRLIALGWGFLVLITINQYISVVSSTLVINNISAGVSGITDLIHRPTGVADYDVTRFEALGLTQVVGLPWNDDQDEVNMLRRLRDRELSALVMDAPFASYQGAINCDLATVGTYVLPVNLAWAFKRGTPDAVVREFDVALTDLQEQNVLTMLATKYITPSFPSCPSKSVSATPEQLSALDLGGLWILLALCVAAGVLVNGLLAGGLHWWARLHGKKQHPLAAWPSRKGSRAWELPAGCYDPAWPMEAGVDRSNDGRRSKFDGQRFDRSGSSAHEDESFLRDAGSPSLRRAATGGAHADTSQKGGASTQTNDTLKGALNGALNGTLNGTLHGSGGGPRGSGGNCDRLATRPAAGAGGGGGLRRQDSAAGSDTAMGQAELHALVEEVRRVRKAQEQSSAILAQLLRERQLPGSRA